MKSVLLLFLLLANISSAQILKSEPHFRVIVKGKSVNPYLPSPIIEDAKVRIRLLHSEQWEDLKYDSIAQYYYLDKMGNEEIQLEISHPDLQKLINVFSINRRPYTLEMIMGDKGDYYLQSGLRKIPFTPYPNYLGIMIGTNGKGTDLLDSLMTELNLEEDSSYLTPSPILGFSSYRESGQILVRKKDGTSFDILNDTILAELRSHFLSVGPLNEILSTHLTILTNQLRLKLKRTADRNDFEQLLKKYQLKIIRNAAPDFLVKGQDGLGYGVINLMEEFLLSGLMEYIEVVPEGIIRRFNHKEE